MAAILRVQSKRLVRSSVALVAAFGFLSVFYLSMFQDFAGDAAELEELMDAFPDAIFDMFGIEAVHTIEGFVAAEVYAFFWVLLLGIYFAYIGAGMIAGEIERREIDLTLSNPVSRESVLIQKVAALWVPLSILNLGVPVILYVGTRLIEEPIDAVAILMVHLLSIPYLLVCAAIGLVLSVVLDRKRTAQATALGLVFVLWLIEGASNIDPDYEWVGYAMPSRYYDPTDVLVHEEFAFFDAAVLLAAFLLLVLVAAGIFVHRDI